MPKSFSSVLLLLSSVSPAPSYAVAVGFLTQVQNPTLFIPAEFCLGGWGMHASVCWCVHSCFLLHQSQVLSPHTEIPRLVFLGSPNLTLLFRLLFSKRSRNQVLWQ